MTGVSCLYRRVSGIYAVRIFVPHRLRDLVGKGEIHTSTGLRDLGAAKLVALKIQSEWREKLMVLDMHRLAAAGPLLQGEGLISVSEASEAMGLSNGVLLTELQSEKSSLFTQARNWHGWSVSDLWDVERDHDDTFVLNDVERIGVQQNLTSIVRAYDTAITIAALITEGASSEAIFRLSGSGGFWPSREISIPISAWMVSKTDLERIRARLTTRFSTSSSHKTSGASSSMVATGTVVTDVITAKHGHKKFSELFTLYRNHQSWGEDQKRRMATESNLFVELMNDPELATIEVETVHEFATRLGRLPSNIYQSRRRYSVTSLTDLMLVAEREKLPLKTPETIKRHIGKIAEVLNYAHRKGMMHANPASGFKQGQNKFKKRRTQDERSSFTTEELELIFAQSWFSSGSGDFSSTGLTNWRPYYYWLPLLGLVSGGRLNELAQLYLDDVRQSDDGTWYLDFNLNEVDKLDADSADSDTDKSLKTVNSIRVVPLHDVVINAGLPEYVTALRKAGYNRLFPELKRDAVKGYGKPAGSWFNERFLGKKLGIKRDGMKTFHSFRHNFATALERLDQPERVTNQLTGHERGKTQSATRYAKDRTVGDLKSVIDGLEFQSLINLKRFNVKAGLNAVRAAIRRKTSASKS